MNKGTARKKKRTLDIGFLSLGVLALKNDKDLRKIVRKYYRAHEAMRRIKEIAYPNLTSDDKRKWHPSHYPPTEVKIIIDYSLNDKFEKIVRVKNFGDILCATADLYAEAYLTGKVWGHGMGDLSVGGISYIRKDRKDGLPTIKFSINS